MAPHSSTLAWKIPWLEEPGGLQSVGSLRVGHDWATSLSLFTFMHRRRKWQTTPCSCLENPRDGGAWWAAVYGVAQSQTRLKWLSSPNVIVKGTGKPDSARASLSRGTAGGPPIQPARRASGAELVLLQTCLGCKADLARLSPAASVLDLKEIKSRLECHQIHFFSRL